MVEEAKANEEADKKRKSEADTRNQAETLINEIDGELAKDGSKIQPAQRDSIMKIRNEIKEDLDKNDLEAVKAKIAQLQQAAYQASQFASQSQANAADGSAAGAGAGDAKADNDSKVYDATDDKEKK